MSGSFTCARCRHSRPSRFIASSPEGVVCGPMPEGRDMCDRSCSCTERSDPCWKPCRILALERNRDEDRREAVAFSVAALLERMRLKPTATNPRPMPSDHLPDGIPGPLASRFLSPPPYPDYREPPRSVTTPALRYMMARLRLIGCGLPVPSKWDSENGYDLSEREVFDFEVYVIRETSPAAERRRLEGDA